MKAPDLPPKAEHPPCTSKEVYVAWLKLAKRYTPNPSFCGDCTGQYESMMRIFGRCDKENWE